jgi:sterol desaturase/sphingolipid hydroxylase (fatty acid hydroxylase superfamily)
MLIAHLDIRPEPLIQLHRDPASWLYWLKVVPLFLLGLVLGDVLIYWIHRAQHRFSLLWRFHAVHHSQTVDALHNINHPVDLLANYLLATIPVAILVPVGPVELVLLSGFFMIQGYLNHMRAPLNLGPLGIILSDNRFHHIHHSRDPADFNTNFAGRFTFVDRLFGTYNRPRESLPETGLSDSAPPRSVAHYFLAICQRPGEASADRPAPVAIGC